MNKTVLTDEELRRIEVEFRAERVRSSDEEYLLIYQSEYWQWQRAIEQAVLAKLEQRQEPVAWMVEDVDGRHFIFRMEKPQVNEGEKLTPLYTTPQPAPALLEAAEKYMAAQNRYAKADMAATTARDNYSDFTPELNELEAAASEVSSAEKELRAAIEACRQGTGGQQ